MVNTAAAAALLRIPLTPTMLAEWLKSRDGQANLSFMAEGRP